MKNPKLLKTILVVAGIYLCYIGLTMFGFLFNEGIVNDHITVFRIIAAVFIAAGAFTILFACRSFFNGKKETVSHHDPVPQDIETPEPITKDERPNLTLSGEENENENGDEEYKL